MSHDETAALMIGGKPLADCTTARLDCELHGLIQECQLGMEPWQHARLTAIEAELCRRQGATNDAR